MFEKPLTIGALASEVSLSRSIVEAGEMISVVVEINDELILSAMHWGYPSPYDDGDLLFNTRLETASDKKMWKLDFQRRRCLIPVDSFWEQRVEFAANDTAPLMMGGLFSKSSHRYSKNPASPNVRNVSMFTMPSLGLVKTYRDRQPAMIPSPVAAAWLDRDRYSEQVVATLAHRQRLIVVG